MRIERWLVLVSAALIAVATLTPQSDGSEMPSFCLICGPLGGTDAVLNVLLFVPIGLSLAVAGMRMRGAFIAAALYSLGIESLQVIAVMGRDASVGDLATNSLGAALGSWVGKHRFDLLAPLRLTAWRLAFGWLVGWLGIQILSAYAQIPTAADPPYYAHVARSFETGRDAFSGRVLSASIASAMIMPPAYEVPHPRDIQKRLNERDGARIQLVLTTPDIRRRSEVFNIGASDFREVVQLDQDGGAVVFRMRTGAYVMRLRPFAYRLDSVFATDSGANRRDTIVVLARYAPHRVELEGRSRRHANRSEFVPRLSQAWRLVTPFQTYIDGDVREHLLSAAFTAALILPAAYWFFIAIGLSTPRVTFRIRLVASAAAIVVAGLVFVPVRFELQPAGTWEWLAITVGVTLGAVLAKLPGRLDPRQRMLTRAQAGHQKPSRNPADP